MTPSAAHGCGDPRTFEKYEAQELDREERLERMARFAPPCDYVAEPMPAVEPAPVVAEPRDSWLDQWRRDREILDRAYHDAAWSAVPAKELLQRVGNQSRKAARAARIEDEKPVLRDLLSAYAHLGVSDAQCSHSQS